MCGNEALAEAAIIAGVDAYFGYPITPQNEITACMSRRMAEEGRVFIQSESELAAINMVFGAEVRGGTSNCTIVFSDSPIASPVVSAPSSLLVLNKASLARFASRLSPDGRLIYNSSLVDTEAQGLDQATVLGVPADELAVELGNQRIANMVMLGAYLQTRDQLTPKQAARALPEVLARRYHHTIPMNTAALVKGAEFSLCAARANVR